LLTAAKATEASDAAELAVFTATTELAKACGAWLLSAFDS
jgi:hypothetical protein